MTSYLIKVQATSLGNKYFLSSNNGNSYIQAPPIQMESTKEITFTIADNSMASHPLYISTSNDTGTDQISNDKNAIISGQGINSQGAELKLTIPSGSIYIGTNLYYVCGKHQGMGNNLSVTEICFPENMKVSTPNGYVNIQDLKRGDFISTKKGISKLARLVITKKYGKVQFVKFKKDSIDISKPSEDLLVTPTHPIFYNSKFIESKELVNGKDITFTYKNVDKIYNIQFETEESVFVNNLEFISHNPNHFIEPLEKDLYFNKNLFDLKKYKKFNSPV